jgi:hypothetical protein
MAQRFGTDDITPQMVQSRTRQMDRIPQALPNGVVSVEARAQGACAPFTEKNDHIGV